MRKLERGEPHAANPPEPAKTTIKSRQHLWLAALLAAAIVSYLALALRPFFLPAPILFDETLDESARAAATAWYRTPAARALWARPGYGAIPEMLRHPLDPWVFGRPQIQKDEHRMLMFLNMGYLVEFRLRGNVWELVCIKRVQT